MRKETKIICGLAFSDEKYLHLFFLNQFRLPESHLGNPSLGEQEASRWRHYLCRLCQCGLSYLFIYTSSHAHILVNWLIKCQQKSPVWCAVNSSVVTQHGCENSMAVRWPRGQVALGGGPSPARPLCSVQVWFVLLHLLCSVPVCSFLL